MCLLQAMVQIMAAMLKADDHTCLVVYIKSRQKAVTALLQAASATGGGAVPAGAAQHRQIQEYGHPATYQCPVLLLLLLELAF